MKRRHETLLAVAFALFESRRRVGAGLSEPADHRDRAVPGRRADRRHHPQSRRADARRRSASRWSSNMSPAPAARSAPRRVARAAPDGYTIICGHFGTHATNGAVYSLPFDLVKDFAPISLLPSNPYLIVVQQGPAGEQSPGVPGLSEGQSRQGQHGAPRRRHRRRICSRVLLAERRRQPDELHALSRRGARHGRSRSPARSISWSIRCRTRWRMCARARSKRWRLPRRRASPQVGDVPTVDEAGAPGLHMSLWYGFWAPAGTPRADRRQAQRRGAGRARRSGGARAPRPASAWKSRRASSRRRRRCARSRRPTSRNGGRSSRPPASRQQ